MACIGSQLFASKIFAVDTSLSIVTKPTVIALPNNSSIKQLIGRKLTFKEKIGLLFLKAKYKNGIPVDVLEAKKANSSAVLGFLLSILGLFFFPFLIGGYILSNNVLKQELKNPGLLTPTNKVLAQIGKATPIVWGILLIIFFFLIIALISSLRF
jgi:hypothetical protein